MGIATYRPVRSRLLHDVSERDALLTRAGSTRAIHQAGENDLILNDLILLIVYLKR